MNKTTKYILAIVILLGLNLLLLFSGNQVTSKSTNSNYFDGVDFSNLRRISFEVGENQFEMTPVDETWLINGEEKVDQGFFSTLISVLERVEINRQLEWSSESNGKITLSFGNDEPLTVDFATNPTKTKSYFIVDGKASEVSVPGYRDNVVDIFMLHPDQWKDRLVIDGSWRTIQRISLKKQNEDDLEIVFDDKFFLVNGKVPSDSSAVVDYLNLFQYLQANEIISPGRISELDSLKKLDPIAMLEIDDIKFDQPISISIYPRLENQAYHLVVSNDQRMMVFDQRRIQSLLRSAKDFGVE